MKFRIPLLVTLTVLLGAACLPAAPSAGRSGPVRKVELIGDSLTWGLFGTTPSVEGPLRAQLAAEGVALTMDGGPGDTVQIPWPGHAAWADELQARINSDDPDVVIIQSVLFPGANDPANNDAYRAAATHLFDIAQSRGAHVYIVAHHAPNNPTEFHAAAVAEILQADAAQGRGISTIPMDWWIARCTNALIPGGWHFTATGEKCWANAITGAVNQLRNTTH